MKNDPFEGLQPVSGNSTLLVDVNPNTNPDCSGCSHNFTEKEIALFDWMEDKTYCHRCSYWEYTSEEDENTLIKRIVDPQAPKFETAGELDNHLKKLESQGLLVRVKKTAST